VSALNRVSLDNKIELMEKLLTIMSPQLVAKVKRNPRRIFSGLNIKVTETKKLVGSVKRRENTDVD
jgi:hypothetical protein